MAPKTTIKFDDRHYHQIMKKFNYEPSRFSRINFALRSVSEEDLQRRWLCHHDADIASERLANGRKTVVSTGIGISGEPHIGTISQIMRLAYLQKAGIDTNFVLGDLDAYNGKNKDLAYVNELTGKYFEFMDNLGVRNQKGSIIREQQHELPVLRTMYLIGKFADEKMFHDAEEELHGFYARGGKVDMTMSYRRRLSLNLMSADFIHLLVENKYDSVIITLGVDEHQYVLFARNVLDKMKESEFCSVCSEKLIAGLYSPLIAGFYGYPKMSKSFPDSSITVLTPDDKIAESIRNGESRQGFPENNVVYQMMAAVGDYLPSELKDIYNACLEHGQAWNAAKEGFIVRILAIKSRWPG